MERWYEIAVLACACQPSARVQGRFEPRTDYPCPAHGLTVVVRVVGQNWTPREVMLTG